MLKKEELKGRKWGQLTEAEQTELMQTATAIDGKTGNRAKNQGECIVDFGNGLSVAGMVEITEDEDVITISDEATLYDSENGNN